MQKNISTCHAKIVLLCDQQLDKPTVQSLEKIQ